MRTLIYNANIITGDGKTILEDYSLVLDHGIIDDIMNVSSPNDFNCDQAIDAKRGYVIPGIINHHTHAIVNGPADSGNAVIPYSEIRVCNNLNQHLLEGETTITSVDGFATMEEVNQIRALTPMLLQTFSLHSPLHFEFAKAVNLGGLKKKNCEVTAQDMIKQGAVGMGEVGGISDISYYSLCYIPTAIKRETGIEISQQDSEFLCDCLFAQPMKKDDAEKYMEKRGILSAIGSLEELVLKSEYLFKVAKDSVFEAADIVNRKGGCLLMHNSPDTKTMVLDLAKELKEQLIAAHSNYLYKPHEAIEMARKVKNSGGWVDIHSGDFLQGRKILFPNHVTALALFIEGLVDLVSTDWSCGYWDSILRMLEFAVNQNVIDLPKAITLATTNVIKAIPNIAPDRGEISKGKIADVVIVNKKRISDVKTVIIGGEVCVDERVIMDRSKKS